jgi:SAM-dependent methyltransferase
MLIKQFFQRILMKNKRVNFLCKLDEKALILDIGCGNNSPYKTKQVLKNCIYTGIDVHDYKQHSKELADEYIVVDKLYFHESIRNLPKKFDAVISAHNLEHCINRSATLQAMMDAVKVGGLMYLSFPCEASTTFPSRKGTLNYYDDETHVEEPPRLEWVIKKLTENNFDIVKLIPNHRPKIIMIIGLIFEPFSALSGRLFPGTWELYGFETIIWAKKLL